MAQDLRSVTVKFHPAMFEQIRLIAEKRGETLSDTIRYLLNRGLSERIYEENTELIARVVRDQMEKVMRRYVILPSMDNVESPENIMFQERVRLCRNNLYS